MCYKHWLIIIFCHVMSCHYNNPHLSGMNIVSRAIITSRQFLWKCTEMPMKTFRATSVWFHDIATPWNINISWGQYILISPWRCHVFAMKSKTMKYPWNSSRHEMVMKCLPMKRLVVSWYFHTLKDNENALIIPWNCSQFQQDFMVHYAMNSSWLCYGIITEMLS